MFSIKINIILKKTILIFPWDIDNVKRIDRKINRKMDTRIKNIDREKKALRSV